MSHALAKPIFRISKGGVSPPLLLFMLALGLALTGAGALPLIDRDEPRFAEASREMLERGDFIVPYFNAAPRLQKPPLANWCQAASFKLFGQSERSARLPSALAAALTALVVYGFARRLYGGDTGFWAGLVFTLSLQTWVLAKAATADMLLALFVTLGMRAGWELVQSQAPPACRQAGWWCVFYGSIALGFLAKGPLALLPAATVIAYAAWTKQKDLNRAMRFELGLPLAIFIVGLWAVPAIQMTHGDYFRVGIGQQVIGRSLGVMDSHGARGAVGYVLLLPFYFVSIFLSFFPWSVFLVPMALFWRKAGNRTAAENYLITGVLLLFLALTPIRTKLPHYTFPAFPALAVLFAGYWSRAARPSDGLRRWAVSTAITALLVFAVVLPKIAGRFPVPRLAAQAASALKPGMEFASAGFNEPSLVWEFRKYVRGPHSPLKDAELAGFMRRPGPRFVVLPTGSAAGAFPARDPAWKRYSASGFDAAKGRSVDLTLLVKVV